ncbi:hypothetical protein [Clostridium botulinum]|uniref:hypothetical protein n=1 Tax=Clostridium botulinum TaxID=1491 RepID=UPI001A9AC183|nr:hypothetical protein [Clostridium botulinum]
MLVIIECLDSIYVRHKQYKIYKEREVMFKEKLKELNATHKKSSNNLISYHSIAGDLARAKEDKKEK